MGSKYLVLAKRPSQAEWEDAKTCANLEAAMAAIYEFQCAGMWVIDLHVRDSYYDQPLR